MVKRISKDDPLRSGRVSRRFSLSYNRVRGNIAKDRFAFEQAMQGHDCIKIRHDGDFVVQKRDFFGNKVGDSRTYEVKTSYSMLTKAQEERKRQLGRNRYKIVRY